MGKFAFKNYGKIRFHSEVQEFLEYINSKNINYQIRYRAIAELKLTIKNEFKNLMIKNFGYFYIN